VIVYAAVASICLKLDLYLERRKMLKIKKVVLGGPILSCLATVAWTFTESGNFAAYVAWPQDLATIVNAPPLPQKRLDPFVCQNFDSSVR